MPNIVSHVVAVSGPAEAVRAFTDKMFTRTGSLDFGALTPMPAILERCESSSVASDGLIILGADHLPDPLISSATVGEQAQRMLDYPWVAEAGVTDRAGLVELLKQRAKADGGMRRRVALAEAALAAFEQTGHVSAGSWAIEHWGSGGALNADITTNEPGRLEFDFGTPWSTPTRIWDRVAEAFPDVVVDVAGFEEAWHFAVVGEIRDGRNGVQEVEPTPELYERVYGEAYEEDEADADDDTPAGDDGPPNAPPAGRDVDPSVASRVIQTLARPETGWRRYKWDLLGCAIGVVVLAGYLLWT